MPKPQRFDVSLAPDEHAQVERLARARGVTVKEAVLDAVRRHLAALGEGRGDDAEPATGRLGGLDDLVGCFDGPADLSTGARHMDGYGA
jgi:hypothetical protein